MSFRISMNDTQMLYNSLDYLNKKYKTDYKIGKRENDLLTKIDDYQTRNQTGQFFGWYGHPGNDYRMEYVFILGFLFGCKDLLGEYKCLYNTVSKYYGDGTDEKRTWYELLKKICSMEPNPYTVDPYPDFMLYSIDKPMYPELCPDVMPKPKPTPVPVPIKPVPKNVLLQQPQKKSTKQVLIFIVVPVLLLIILSNNYMYKLSNMAGGYTLNEKGPTHVGMLVHGLLFAVMVYLVYKIDFNI